MGEHTPTPWFVDLGRWTPDSPVCAFAIRSAYEAPNLPEGWRMHYIAGANISERAAFTACFTPEQIEANAAFIVKSVNSHDALVKALEATAFALDLVQSAVWEDDKQRLTFAGLWKVRAPVIEDATNRAREALAKAATS